MFLHNAGNQRSLYGLCDDHDHQHDECDIHPNNCRPDHDDDEYDDDKHYDLHESISVCVSDDEHDANRPQRDHNLY